MNNAIQKLQAELEYYQEHPDQAKAKLQIPDRLEFMRSAYIEYVSMRKLGPKEILLDIDSRIKNWVRPEYTEHVSKTLNAVNLRDFRSCKSDLKMPSRLLIHAYV